jgi:thioredoxin 1
MGAIKAVTDESFEVDVLQNSKPVIVEYWAEWCGPCRLVSPVLEAIAREHADKIDVVKLNTDENPETMQRYGVLAVPTMHAFSGGEVVRQVIGAKSKSTLLRDFADFIGAGGTGATHLPGPPASRRAPSGTEAPLGSL